MPEVQPLFAMLGVPEIVMILVVLGTMTLVLVGVVYAIVRLSRPKGPPPAAPVAGGAASVGSGGGGGGGGGGPSPRVEPVGSAGAGASAACPKCGTPRVGGGGAEGLCPKCLLAAGIGTQSAPSAGGGTAGASTPDPELLARLFPQLEILELLGQGGMGFVFRARQRKLDRGVALKVLPRDAQRDPAFVERFHREARALARLQHPNIVAVHDFGEVEGLCYLVMEYVDGADLRRVLEEGRLGPEEALRIVPIVCDALQYAHANGVVHRDIKPANILLDREGRVKIADFGIAKIADASAEVTLTQSRQSMGTPHYMAPEQVEAPSAVDHRADIYSLGVVFYEMLTGELPLGRFEPPSRRVQVDVRLDDVVLRALAKEPDRRYQRAADVKTEVERIARDTDTGGGGGVKGSAGRGQESSGPGRSGGPWPGSGRGWAMAALVAALGVVPYFLVYWGARDGRSFHPLAQIWAWMGVMAPVAATALGWLGVWAGWSRGLPDRVVRGRLAMAYLFPVLGLGAFLVFSAMLVLTEAVPGVRGETWLFWVVSGVGAVAVGFWTLGLPRLGRAVVAAPGFPRTPVWWAQIAGTLLLTVLMGAMMGVLLEARNRTLSRVQVTHPTPAELTIDPSTGMPLDPRAAFVDPATGLPAAGVEMVVDPNTGQMIPAIPGASRSANGESKPAAESTPDPVAGQPAPIVRVETQGRPPVNLRIGEAPPWEIRGGVPVWSDAQLIRFLDGAGSEKMVRLQSALTEAWAAYRQCLRTNIAVSTNELGHRVLWVRPMVPAIEAVEGEFWTRVDAVLGPVEQGVVRQMVEPWMKGRWYGDHSFRNERTLFRYGVTGYILEYWRVGAWFHWFNLQGDVIRPQTLMELPNRTLGQPNKGPDLGDDKLLHEVAESLNADGPVPK